MDAIIRGGNSGGPLVSRSGQIVGVNTKGLRASELVAYAVKPEFISRFLSDIVGSVPYSPRANFDIPDMVEQVRPSVFQILNYAQ